MAERLTATPYFPSPVLLGAVERGRGVRNEGLKLSLKRKGVGERCFGFCVSHHPILFLIGN